jgi:DNA-binding MarR family transcriptional regulator
VRDLPRSGGRDGQRAVSAPEEQGHGDALATRATPPSLLDAHDHVTRLKSFLVDRLRARDPTAMKYNQWGPMHRSARRTDKQTRLRTTSGRRVMNALRRIVRDLRLGTRSAERTAGVSGAQLFVLQALDEQPAASLNDLAERTLTDQSSVSVVVHRLTARKLVASRVSRVDARRVELSLTAAGRRLLARCPEPTQARLVAALERLSPTKLAGLTQGLDALVQQMGITGAAPRMFFDEDARTRRSARASRRDAA